MVRCISVYVRARAAGWLAIALVIGQGCSEGYNLDESLLADTAVPAQDGADTVGDGDADAGPLVEVAPRGDPCNMGDVGTCACPGSSEQGMRACLADPTSSLDGFFGECTGCPAADDTTADPTTDGGPCADGIKNGSEADTDCGGPDCDPCAVGDSCVGDADCMDGVCTGFVCVAPPDPGRCADPTSDACSFPFTPSNFDPTALDPGPAGALTTIDCDAELSTDGTPSFTTWCAGTEPPIAVQTQTGGGEVVVVVMQSLDLGGSLTVVGARPVVLAIWGDATIQSGATVDVSAAGRTPGAGGNQGCEGMGQGGDSTSTSGNTGGGGGGGFGTAGGAGGTGDNGAEPAGEGGVAHGTAELQPLLAGCAGGTTGECNEAGGAGGGAVQISAAGTLRVAGTVAADGGDGESRNCGAGGGSGGGILLEGFDVDVGSATLSARGGDGSDASAGGPNGASGSSSPDAPGGDGSPGNNADGGSGGGGGYGRIHILAQGGSCTGAGCN